MHVADKPIKIYGVAGQSNMEACYPRKFLEEKHPELVKDLGICYVSESGRNPLAGVGRFGVDHAMAAPRKVFGKGHPFTAEELPAGELKSKLQSLNPKAKKQAILELHAISFGALDAAVHLRVNHEGGIFMVCPDANGNCKGHSKIPDLPNHNASTTESIISDTPRRMHDWAELVPKRQRASEHCGPNFVSCIEQNG